jgi:uncharacterized protein (DUF1778 family)
MQKTETARLRLTPDEKETFTRAAELAGLSVSAWMRARLRKAAMTELEEMGQQIPFLQARRRAS